MAKPKFRVNITGKNKNATISYDISISRNERLRGLTNQRVNIDYWDNINQVVKPIDNYKRDALKINNSLLEFEDFIEKTLNELKSEENKYNISEELRNRINVYYKRTKEFKEDKRVDLFDYIDSVVEAKKEVVGKATIGEYKRVKELLIDFKKDENYNLTFESMKMTFYNEFIQYLAEGTDERDPMKTNTIGKHIKNIKMFLKGSYSKNFHNNRIFMEKSFQVISEESFNTYLNIEELESIAKLDLPEKPGKARDYFLLMAYTALRIGDVLKLTKEDNIRIVKDVKMIVFNESKTQKKNRRKNKKAFIFTPEMEIILEKYDGHFPNEINTINQNFPNIIIEKVSSQYINENIKIICKSAGINELIKGIPKYKYIHCHTARRSFCTNRRLAGDSLDTIRLQSFHSSDAILENYIKANNEEIIAEMHLKKQNL